jgi:hypothetical protein
MCVAANVQKDNVLSVSERELLIQADTFGWSKFERVP